MLAVQGRTTGSSVDSLLSVVALKDCVLRSGATEAQNSDKIRMSSVASLLRNQQVNTRVGAHVLKLGPGSSSQPRAPRSQTQTQNVFTNAWARLFSDSM